MLDTTPIAAATALAGGVGLAVLVAARVADRLRVPLAVFVLVAAAVIAWSAPSLRLHPRTASDVVSLALVAVLFDGGMQLGRSRSRAVGGPILVCGVLGTCATAALCACVARGAFAMGWYPALLLGAAVAPTDPAVVFSVLGRRRVGGPGGTILAGESGANDPVGIALVASLLTAGRLGWSGASHALGIFAEQMAIGSLVGVVGGWALLRLMRRRALPSEGLYPLQSAIAALLIFGGAALAEGSGFLAVFVAGIFIGDERYPYHYEVHQFHGAVASLAEIVAFVGLGLTLDVNGIWHTNVVIPGVVLAALLAAVIRPGVIAGCLAPFGMGKAQRRFVEFAGLRGAVPLLLGLYLASGGAPGGRRLYDIVVVVVVLSVAFQGTLAPLMAERLGLPVELVEPEPWFLGVRLRANPEEASEFVVARGAAADGSPVDGLVGLPASAWLTLLVRDGRVLPVRGGTVLQAGDRVTAIVAPADRPAAAVLFDRPAAGMAPGGAG